MSSIYSDLQPAALWKYFAAINAIPRASKKEAAIIRFMMDFGEQLKLETHKDEAGNVIIKKGATAGMEDRQTVCLQSHLDMVHQKNADTVFDFDKDGIKMYVDGDWVKAKGTTLGADNGIGVATIMALLASEDIPHPPLEGLFTIDEETGMTGAFGLQGGLLEADILLNLDTEEDDELTIGCAGGVDITITGNYNPIPLQADAIALRIGLKGLTGGHSGMDIHKGRGNANLLMIDVLLKALEKFEIQISAFEGGSLRNAIPREANTIIAVNARDKALLQSFIEEQNQLLRKTYAATDPELKLNIQECALPETGLEIKFQHQLLNAISQCPNGVYSMSETMEGLVQTSNNIARVVIDKGSFKVLCLTRSSVEDEKYELAKKIEVCFDGIDIKNELSGGYPGWEPKPGAHIVEIMSELYVKKFNHKPNVDAVHAGLECGIIGTNYPSMQMISFGPNIYGAHSPDEKVQISSVQKFWDFLLDTLKGIPTQSD